MMSLKDQLQPYKKSDKPIEIKIGHTYPHGVERQYASDMRKIVKFISGEIKANVLPVLKEEIRARDERNDSGERMDYKPTFVTHRDSLERYDDVERFDQYEYQYVERMDGLRDILERIRRLLGNLFIGDAMAERFAGQTYNSNEKNISDAINSKLGITIALPGGDRTMVDDWVVQNTDLIQDLQEQYLKRVQSAVSNGFIKGQSYRDIAKDIQKSTDITWRRARNIARDQIGTLNSQLTEFRNKELGIEEGIWRTMQDERVRGNPSGLYPKAIPSHYAREGVKFKLNEGIDGELPGQPILCRCWTESVIEI